MPVYISLLRAINLAGNSRIKMEELRDLYKSLDLKGAKTHLQSGNVIFESDSTDRAALIKKLEQGIEEKFGFHSDVILRTPAEIKAVIEGNLFEQEIEPTKLLVMFLASTVADEDVEALKMAYAGKGSEEIRSRGSELYLHYPDGVGRSKLTSQLMEKKIKSKGTARNWNTVLALLRLSEEFSAT